MVVLNTRSTRSDRVTRPAIAAASRRFERHFVIGLHNHLARFGYGFAVHQKTARRAWRAAAETFWCKGSAARDRIEKPWAGGAHAPTDRLPVAAAGCAGTARTDAKFLFVEHDRHGRLQYFDRHGRDAGRIAGRRRSVLSPPRAHAARVIEHRTREGRVAG